MAEQKYSTEFSLNFSMAKHFIILPSDIPKVLESPESKETLAKCHIYFIVKRPRLTLIPDSLSLENGNFSGQFRVHKKGQHSIGSFTTSTTLFTSFKISDYPHNNVIMTRNDGEEFIINFSLHAYMFLEPYHPEMALEVVYIGQAFGKNGKRTAIDRLASHSTLQKVQSDIITDDPDSEIFLLLFEFHNPMNMFKMVRDDHAQITGDDDLVHSRRITREPIPEANRISIIEASLIRYFQPHYNIIYKDKFPSTKIKSLQKCYELDYSAFAVWINIEEPAVTIFSGKTINSYKHIAEYNLRTEADRRSFFCFP